MQKYTKRHSVVACVIFGVMCLPYGAIAQIETIENGGIVDRNTQQDNEEDDDERDLDDDDYRPENLTASTEDDGSVRLSWEDNAKEENGYTVQRKSGGGSWQSIADLDGSTERYTDRSTKPDTVYTYRVRAYNNSSETEYADSVTVTTPPLTTEELLAYDAVQQEIQRAVEDSVEEKEAVISDLEKQLRVANEDLKKSSEKLEQTSICSIEEVPESQIVKIVEERCERIPGANTVEAVTEKTTSIFSQVFSSTKGRLILSGLFLFAILNNVVWHITHKSVRKELHHHRGEHHRLRDLLHRRK